MGEIREKVREVEAGIRDRDNYEIYENFGVDDIRELLHKGQYTRLRQLVQELNDADFADYLEHMDEEEIVKVFRILPKDMAADAAREVENGMS